MPTTQQAVGTSAHKAGDHVFVTIEGNIGTANLGRMDGHTCTPIGYVRTEYVQRIVALLNRHGLEDCTTEDLADAIVDLEARGH